MRSFPPALQATCTGSLDPFTQADLAQAISTTVARPDEGRVIPFRKGEPNSPLRGEEVRGNVAPGHCVVPKRSARHSTLGGSGIDQLSLLPRLSLLPQKPQKVRAQLPKLARRCRTAGATG